MTIETARPRLLEAERKQLGWRTYDLDSCIAEDHRVRQLWAFVEQLDLSEFEKDVLSRGSRPGRPAIDPRVLITLWLQGILDGIGSARELSRRCETDDVYRWICGGVGVSYRTLSEFRVEYPVAVDELLTQVIAVMTHAGLASLECVAQDGTKIRASAGSSSFRREQSLENCYEQATARIDELRGELHDPCINERRRAAKERAAEDRAIRVAEALKQMPELKKIKEKRARKSKKKCSEARVSTTDPDARVMKVADGGYRPAYNVQLAAESKGRIIIGVQVVQDGSDANVAAPMLKDEIQRRTGTTPKEYLVDGGIASRESVKALTDEGITVYAALKKPKDSKHDQYEPKPQDNEAYAALRLRMKTDEAKAKYRERGALIETVNADLVEHRGLRAFRVRGLPKVTTVVLWMAIAYNLMRWISLANPSIG
jgi:transposase